MYSIAGNYGVVVWIMFHGGNVAGGRVICHPFLAGRGNLLSGGVEALVTKFMARQAIRIYVGFFQKISDVFNMLTAFV